MIHRPLSLYPEQTGAHWAVGVSSSLPLALVLVQFQDQDARLIRVGMTPAEAREMAQELEYWAHEAAKAIKTN